VLSIIHFINSTAACQEFRTNCFILYFTIMLDIVHCLRYMPYLALLFVFTLYQQIIFHLILL